MEKKRVLIVDDEESLTRVFKLLIENTGKYEVKEETMGSKAFAAAKEFRPDLVLLDIMMPDIDGGEVARQLKANEETRDVPVVFISAAITKEEENEQGVIKGGYPILAKPVPLDKLLATIEKYTGEKNEKHSINEKKKWKGNDRRRHKRVDTLNLLAYECIDEKNTHIDRGMGRVLNISQQGLLLETSHLIKSKNILLASSDIEDDLIDIKGKIIYSESTGEKTFHSGIEFDRPDENVRKFIVELIKVFSMQKSRKSPALSM